jgi:hypothetical protein
MTSSLKPITNRGLHKIEEKAHDFSRGMNPITHDTIHPSIADRWLMKE